MSAVDRPARVVYCTSGGLYGALVLARLLRAPEVEVTGVILSTRVLRKNQGSLTGAVSLARQTGIRYAVYLGVATALADMLLGPSSVRTTARRQNIALLRTRDANDSEGRSFVAECKPDLLLSGFFNQRLDHSLCAIPSLGAVNIHPGALPELRGVDPVFQARRRLLEPLQVTLHEISPEFDCGAILARRSMECRGQASLLADTACLFCIGAQLFIESVESLGHGRSGDPQVGPAGYDSWPSAADVDELLKRGVSLFDRGDLRRLRCLGQWCE